MAETLDPVTDTRNAIKTRMAGPFGTFLLIWIVSHPKVITYLLFDCTGKSDLSQAEAKIQKIAPLLHDETVFDLFWEPILWTILAMLLLQVTTLIWHYVSEWFRYFRERITAQKDFRIAIYKRFGADANDVLANVSGVMKHTIQNLQNFPNIGNQISALNMAVKNEQIILEMKGQAEHSWKKLNEAMSLLKEANQESLLTLLEKRFQKGPK